MLYVWDEIIVLLMMNYNINYNNIYIMYHITYYIYMCVCLSSKSKYKWTSKYPEQECETKQQCYSANKHLFHVLTTFPWLVSTFNLCGTSINRTRISQRYCWHIEPGTAHRWSAWISKVEAVDPSETLMSVVRVVDPAVPSMRWFWHGLAYF